MVRQPDGFDYVGRGRSRHPETNEIEQYARYEWRRPMVEHAQKCHD